MPISQPRSDTSQALRVLVVDDHALLSETLADALEKSDSMVVETVGDLQSALDRIARNGAYDAVLLDYELPGVQGLNGLRQLMAANGGRVALFSGVVGWAVAKRALAIGAAGFLPKTLPLKVLAQALGLIGAGGVYVPADLMPAAGADPSEQTNLRPREQRVLACLSEGMTNKEIAQELELDEVIVKASMRAIFAKLGASNRTQALIMARKMGVI